MRKQKRCADCRDGEHDNIDENVHFVKVFDPDLKKTVKRAYLCQAHRIMFRYDGYEVDYA